MMKKILSTVLFIFLTINLYSYDMKSFSKLTPEEQVDLWIEEYKDSGNYSQQLQFARTISFFTLEENIPDIKPLLLKKLQEYKMLPLNVIPRTFDMISQVLYSDYYYVLTTSEINELISIIQKNLDLYVQENKIIDSTVIYYSCIIKRLHSGDKMSPSPADEDPVEILNYYETLGFSDIQIEWDTLTERYGIERK